MTTLAPPPATIGTTPLTPGEARVPARFSVLHQRRTRVLLLIAAIGVMSLADLAMTLTYMSSVGMLESNPIARAMVQWGGPALLIAWKLLTVGIASVILAAARRTLVGELGAVLGCAMLGWLMFHWVEYIDHAHVLTPALCSLSSGAIPDWVQVTDPEPAGLPGALGVSIAR